MSRWGWCLCCLVLACRDDGVRRYEDAKARHIALVQGGARPESKGFDEVIALLEQVPATSPRAGEAQRLKQAIVAARQRVRRPLAAVHSSDRDLPESVRAQTRACAALAEGAARDGGASAQLLKALDDCRRRIEKLDVAYHDSMEPPVDDLSQRLEARMDAGARP